MEMFLLEANSTIWIANSVTTVIVLGVIGFFFKRYVNQQDEKYKELEKKTKASENRSKEIETNYIARFDDVNKEINRSNKELQGELVKEIRAVTKEKSEHELKQAIDMTELKGDMKSMQKTFEQILRVLK